MDVPINLDKASDHFSIRIKDCLEEVNQRLEFWVDLNNYAVSQRGETSRNKYRNRRR